jgi:hypothetical protein
LDSRGNAISADIVSRNVSIIGARNFRGGLPDADPNLSFRNTDRRGIGGLSGKFREMMETHVGIAAAVYWSIVEGAALPLEVVWHHRNEPDADAERFMELCRVAVLDEAVVIDGMMEGANALWSMVLLDPFIGFGLMAPRMMEGGAVEWYPVAHNAVMLWRPDGYLLGGVRFSTPNGYEDIDAKDLVHTVHGLAGAGEFEGRSLLRDCVQPFELWKQIAINAGVYNQQTWGFLDIAYDPSVSESDLKEMQEYALAFTDGERKFVMRPKSIELDLRYPSGTPPDMIAQLEYWDRQIEKKLNAPLAGLAQFGSRAMAETLDAASSRKAIAWLNSTFERTSRGMFTWLARQVGYEGKLPTVNVQSAQMTTGLDGWSAYVQGVQAGLLTKGPEDEAWGRRILGAPEVAPVEAAEDAPAPLLVGSLQVAQAVLASLSPTEDNPRPLAPAAAILLLQSAGIQEAAARAMVDAQMAAPAAPTTATMAPTSAGGTEAAVQGAAAAPTPAVAPPSASGTVAMAGNVEVPAAIGNAPAFAPVSTSAREARLAGDEVDTTPTAEMAAAAERALEWRGEHGRGGTEVGVARARDLSNLKTLSEDTVRRMANYFTRHEVDKDAEGFNDGEDGFPSAGRIAWDLWGGDAGAAWAERKVAEFDRKAGDLADQASMLAASLADHPDVVVPDSVMQAAMAALDAHRAVSKGRTTDAAAVVYARDLAAGRRLAWSRILKLANYFTQDHARLRQSKSYLAQGPAWHAYQLRGGDACREWVRSLIQAYAMHAHKRAARLHDAGHGCGCAAHGDLADDEDGVLVVGADGKEFLTWRSLRPEEEVVAWVTLAEGRRDLDAQLQVRIGEIADRHRLAVRKALRDGWQDGERDAVWSQFAAEYQTALTEAGGTLRNAVGEEVAREAKRSARSGIVASKVSGSDASAIASKMAAQADAAFGRAAAMTQKAGEVMADRVQGEVESAILGGARMQTWASRITLEGLVSSALESRNTIEAAARVATYASTPEAAGMVPTTVIRTSIPDRNRCEVCTDRDGEKFEVADWVTGDGKDAELALPELPDPQCEGGVGRCRCGWLAVYGEVI